MKKLFALCSLPFAVCAANAAVTPRAAVIATTPRVSARVEATGLYSQECYDAYFGCMDQFCRSENDSGGTCPCSDESKQYEAQMEKIRGQNNEADRLATIEVERIQAGARADIVFGGERNYDEKGNVVTTPAERARAARTQRQLDLLSLWNDAEESDADVVASISTKTGDALHSAAKELCVANVPASCQKDMAMLGQLYSTQIRNDCRGFAGAVANMQKESDARLAAANAEVRSARMESFNEANRFNRGQCLIEFKSCMVKPEVCGADWSRCAASIASENMQNNKAVSVAGTTVASIEKYQLTASTLEMLDSKRNMCEGVLDQCMAVRDSVWPDFLRDIAPELKTAELNLESNMRQSCMTDISNCITGKACQDLIRGDGNIDACLSNDGQIARATCKNVIDPCERMEPRIWEYVVARLRAVAVDRCTDEVKSCFTQPFPVGCGENFSNCIGMDYNFMHNMCPIDKLVVCKNMYQQKGQEFTMSDLDRMLMGFYLNVDNAMLEECQNQVTAKMQEFCGSTTDCNRFAADDTMGTGSLNFQKDGGVYRITGMISFGKIQIGTGVEKVQDLEGKTITLGAGEVNLRDYFESLGALGVPQEYGRVVDNIYFELQNIQGNVNNVIRMLEQDPKIQFCMTGRNMSQITGAAQTTTARFPNLLNQVRMQIAISAIRQAQDNYNREFNRVIAEATRNANADVANLMCNKLPFSNGSAMGTSAADFENSMVNVPYAIVLEIGGISTAALAAGGTHTSENLGGARMETTTGAAAGASNGGAFSTFVAGGGITAAATVATAAMKGAGAISKSLSGAIVKMNPVGLVADAAVKAIGILGSSRHTVEFDGGKKEMWSLFDREGRNCHYCTKVIEKNCKTTGSRGFLGLWDSRGMQCEENAKPEECHDIKM